MANGLAKGVAKVVPLPSAPLEVPRLQQSRANVWNQLVSAQGSAG